MKKLIIFDMDGVLIDSEPIYNEFYPVFYRERLGIHLTSDDLDAMTGVATTETFARYKTLYNLPETPEYYTRQAYDLLLDQFANLPELPAIRGITEFLKLLKASNFHLAVSSSNQRQMVQLSLKRLGLDAFFENVLSGEDVPRAKPDPEIFSRQAVHFGVLPAECVVIEDSTNGVKAAKAANMFCIGFMNPNSGHQDLTLADWHVTEWTEPVVERVLTMGQISLV